MKAITMYSDNEDFEAIYFLLCARKSWIDSSDSRGLSAEIEIIRKWQVLLNRHYKERDRYVVVFRGDDAEYMAKVLLTDKIDTTTLSSNNNRLVKDIRQKFASMKWSR